MSRGYTEGLISTVFLGEDCPPDLMTGGLRWLESTARPIVAGTNATRRGHLILAFIQIRPYCKAFS